MLVVEFSAVMSIAWLVALHAKLRPVQVRIGARVGK